jgi:hypothetical protein
MKNLMDQGILQKSQLRDTCNLENAAFAECFTPVGKHAAAPRAYQTTTSCSGYCKDCDTVHHFPLGQAAFFCQKIMTELDNKRRVDYEDSTANPKFSTDYLFGPARGQMFGVLVCQHPNGTIGTLKAFSGQYDGNWSANGWVPPLFNINEMESLCVDVEKEIKQLGQAIENGKAGNSDHIQLVKERRLLSQNLMRRIHALYTLTNFKGQSAPLVKIFQGNNKGIPTGAGDCCAPKLLGYAARHQLTPLGLAEFFWGRENRSQTRQHKIFYPACKEKCEPILGFMLCGLNNRNEK